VLFLTMAFALFGPVGMFPPYTLALIAGIASGAAMIPYTIIKEANRPEHAGTATGVINFINFSFSAVLGPMFAARLVRISGGDDRVLADYQATFQPMLYGIALAIILTLLLRETGTAKRAPAIAPQPLTEAR
jgi:MFS family permease